jgi:uridine kinase
MTLQKIFNAIEDKISRLHAVKNKPFRIAINGIEGVGKTTFAENLVNYLQSREYSAFHVSIDGFHFNKKRRYKQGRDSAKGYYEDSYDEQGFADKVLKMSQNEHPQYIPATHDLETDEYLDIEPIDLTGDSILITDGAYLFKPTYEPHWDLKIYLKTSFEEAVLRGAKRDTHLGSEAMAKKMYVDRYHAASQMYINKVGPENLSDIVIDNTDFENPIILD